MSVEQIIETLGGGAKIARFCGFPHSSTVGEWKRARSIPVKHWPMLIRMAEELGVLGITADSLMRVHAPLPPAPQPEPEAAR